MIKENRQNHVRVYAHEEGYAECVVRGEELSKTEKNS